MGARQRARQQAGNSRRLENTGVSPLTWIGAIGIALFFLIFPYDRGLFNGYEISFEPSLYGATIFISVLAIVTAISLFRTWKPDGYRAILSVAALILPLVYWLSSFQAVSTHYANLMVVVYFALAGLLIAGLYFAEAAPARMTIEAGLMAAGYIIVCYGLLNLFGQIYYRDALWLAHDGYRLASVFQYSNTYAGFLIALFLMSLYYAVHCERFALRLIHAAMLVPIWISFMFTYSRGAIVIIPVIVLIILPFLRLSKQIAYMAFAGISVLVSMSILGKLTANADTIAAIVQPTDERGAIPLSLFKSYPLQSWGLLLLGAAIVTALILLYRAKADAFVEAKLEKLAEKRWSIFAIPAIIVVIGAAAATLLLASSSVRGLLPEKLADRLESINFQQHSVLERVTFYEDGLKVAQDYPLLGGGGGAWQALFEQYQNNPYWSRQAHSFFVQVLVETGWLGLLTLLGLLGFIYFLYIRSYIRHPELRGSHFVFFILSFSLLLHSAIDFDMSYLYISALVFISLGCMLAPYSGKLVIAKLDNLTFKPWQKISYPAVLALLSITFLVVSTKENRAANSFFNTVEQAMKQQVTYTQLMANLEKSVKASPKNTAFALKKIDWLMQGYEQSKNPQQLEAINETIAAGKKYDPYNRGIYVLQLILLQSNEQLEESLPIVEETLVKFPWDITFYETAMTSYVQARQLALANQNNALAEQYGQRVLAISNEVQRRIDQLATLPEEQQQGRSFDFTPAMQEAIAALQ